MCIYKQSSFALLAVAALWASPSGRAEITTYVIQHTELLALKDSSQRYDFLTASST